MEVGVNEMFQYLLVVFSAVMCCSHRAAKSTNNGWITLL